MLRIRLKHQYLPKSASMGKRLHLTANGVWKLELGAAIDDERGSLAGRKYCT
jgi:hypothetical protein